MFQADGRDRDLKKLPFRTGRKPLLPIAAAVERADIWKLQPSPAMQIANELGSVPELGGALPNSTIGTFGTTCNGNCRRVEKEVC